MAQAPGKVELPSAKTGKPGEGRETRSLRGHLEGHEALTQ
jgi:hypothetical protein